MTELTCDVAVVGAGPTGLTLANILGHAGVRTMLIERNDTTVQEPRAVSIDDESLRTMQALGMDAAIMNDAALDCGYHCFGPDGACFLKVEPTVRPYGFPRRSNFEQPVLEATLRDALLRLPQVTLLFAHACDDAVADADGVILGVRPPDGGAISIRARYVVGCDGAKSAMRRAIGATLKGSSYEQRWLIVDLGSTRERLRQSRVFCNPKRPAITLGGPRGVRRYEFMLHDDERDDEATADVFVRALLAAHGPDADAPIVRRQVYTVHARIADRWQTGRIFLAGDAAHLSPPFAGQGMNSGVRDAHNLGWKLVDVIRGTLGPDVLDTYAQERAPHAAALIQMAVDIGRVMMPASSLQAALLRLGFRAAGLIRPVQRYFAEMKFKPQPFYQAGFLVPHDDAAIVGRMIPQPILEIEDGRRARLDDVVGSGFAIIAYGAHAQRSAAAAAGLDVGVGPLRRLAILPADYNRDRTCVVDDVTVGRDVNDLLARFCGQRDSVMIVRPDRYVAAAAASDAASLSSLAASMRALVADTWGNAVPGVMGSGELR